MEEQQLIDAGFNETVNVRKQRWSLVPLWMKVFTWIFMILGPFALIVGLIGLFSPPLNFTMSFYGFNSTVNTPLLTVVLSCLFLLKAAVSFGLWRGKKWAMKMAIVDAAIGIVVCLFSMFVLTDLSTFYVVRFDLRVELIFLIPYLIKPSS